MFTDDVASWWLLVGKGGDSRYGSITVACLQTKKNNLKKYFYAKAKDREVVKKRVYAKIHTRGIKVYYSIWKRPVAITLISKMKKKHTQ